MPLPAGGRPSSWGWGGGLPAPLGVSPDSWFPDLAVWTPTLSLPKTEQPSLCSELFAYAQNMLALKSPLCCRPLWLSESSAWSGLGLALLPPELQALHFQQLFLLAPLSLSWLLPSPTALSPGARLLPPQGPSGAQSRPLAGPDTLALPLLGMTQAPQAAVQGGPRIFMELTGLEPGLLPWGGVFSGPGPGRGLSPGEALQGLGLRLDHSPLPSLPTSKLSIK